MSDKSKTSEKGDPSQPHDLLYLLQGADDFSRLVFPDSEALFKSLAHRQTPHTLFITCADSRVSPEMITQTRPGELFVCRNIGNIVPAYGEMLGGVSAVVEFAVLALNVQQIVICGHSDCGAMKGLASGATIADEMPTVHAWLRNAEAARSVVMARKLEEERIVQAMVEENIRLQLNHLRTHPAVAGRLALGQLQVQGWVYDIGRGKVSIFDEADGKFESLEEARLRMLRKDAR